MADNEEGNLEPRNQSNTQNVNNLINQSPDEIQSDNTLGGLLEIVVDVNKRLQNVDVVHRKMQQHKEGMNKELQSHKEQLSLIFQENCSLQEKVARLDIDKKNFFKENSDLRKENEKLNRLLEENRDKQKRSFVKDESNHSSFESFNDSIKFASNKTSNSGTSINRFKNQVITEPTKNESSNSSSVVGSMSLLDDDAASELILQKLDLSLKNLNDLKKDLSYMNYSLKYIIYSVYNSKLKGRYVRPTSSYLVARGGGEPDSLEDPLPPQSKGKWLTQTPNRMSASTENPFKNTSRTFQPIKSGANFSENHPDEEILESFFKRRHLPWPSQSFSDISIQENRPIYARGVSTEALASSLPSSCSLLSPDSLGSYQVNSESEGVSGLLKEERICPICQAKFPPSVPQNEFEQHAENHFALDEYELVT